MTPYYADEQVTLYHGDALDVLRTLPESSVDCVVTSPPYYGLRDYGTGEWQGGDPECDHGAERRARRQSGRQSGLMGSTPGSTRDPVRTSCRCGAVLVDRQYGLEPSPAEYVETMRAVFAEVRRVLANDGTLWLNLGDSYYSGKGSPTQPDVRNEARRPPARVLDIPGQPWGKPKSLLGIPWRVAFALQEDGWILRNAIVWDKPNAMPESVTDRLSVTYEMVFMFAKSRRYHFDLDAIRVPFAPGDQDRGVRTQGGAYVGNSALLSSGRRCGRSAAAYGAAIPPGANRPKGAGAEGFRHELAHPKGRNPGDVWTLSTQPFPEAHFAVMAPECARRCVVAGCRPGGVVLDPFCGSGTTGMVAQQHGRRFVGIDLNRDYLDLALRTRLAQAAIVDAPAAVPTGGQ